MEDAVEAADDDILHPVAIDVGNGRGREMNSPTRRRRPPAVGERRGGLGRRADHDEGREGESEREKRGKGERGPAANAANAWHGTFHRIRLGIFGSTGN